MAPLTLIDILSNEYLLLHTTPYLLPTELLALGLCSHSYHSLITHSRSVWRHLNLSLSPSPPQTVSTAIAQRTATPRYQSELHTLLQKPFVLRDVRTLVLDGLPVTVELLHDLLNGDRCRLQLLSIRECNMINERQLMQLFQYLVRPSRETPLSLKGCYWFGGMDAPGGIFPSELKPRDTSARGRFVSLENLDKGWVGILRACERTIAFDTRLCTGPRHDQGDGHFLEPQVANIRLASDCSGCGSSPEARRGVAGLPKVVCPPVPLMSSDIRVACRSAGALEKDVLRCEDCAKDRWCEHCGKWWCETCVAKDSDKKLVSLDCYECGMLCADCTKCTSRTCRSCRGEYCVVHNTGADNNWCDWCNSPGRRVAELQRTSTNQYALQQRARTLARLNAIRSSLGVGRFKDEAIVRNRCSLVTL